MDETQAALDVAAVVPFEHLVVHLGVPATDAGAATTAAARWSAASRSCRRWPHAVGVRLALEVIPNALSTPSRW